jgi:hypothetical protein
MSTVKTAIEKAKLAAQLDKENNFILAAEAYLEAYGLMKAEIQSLFASVSLSSHI